MVAPLEQAAAVDVTRSVMWARAGREKPRSSAVRETTSHPLLAGTRRSTPAQHGPPLGLPVLPEV